MIKSALSRHEAEEPDLTKFRKIRDTDYYSEWENNCPIAIDKRKPKFNTRSSMELKKTLVQWSSIAKHRHAERIMRAARDTRVVSSRR